MSFWRNYLLQREKERVGERDSMRVSECAVKRLKVSYSNKKRERHKLWPCHWIDFNVYWSILPNILHMNIYMYILYMRVWYVVKSVASKLFHNSVNWGHTLPAAAASESLINSLTKSNQMSSWRQGLCSSCVHLKCYRACCRAPSGFLRRAGHLHSFSLIRFTDGVCMRLSSGIKTNYK